MEKGLLEKTGKSLEHWVSVVKATQLDKHKTIMDFLKSEHGFTHGFANFVALKARQSDAASHAPEDLVEKQYTGKESLRPIYEQLITEISAFGTDITTTPKKDSVSLIRKRQFALIKPATKSRIDLGLKLKGKEIGDRLEGSGPFGITIYIHNPLIVSLLGDFLFMWSSYGSSKACGLTRYFLYLYLDFPKFIIGESLHNKFWDNARRLRGKTQ